MLFYIALMSSCVYGYAEFWQLLLKKNGFKPGHVQRNVTRMIREWKIPFYRNQIKELMPTKSDVTLHVFLIPNSTTFHFCLRITCTFLPNQMLTYLCSDLGQGINYSLKKLSIICFLMGFIF